METQNSVKDPVNVVPMRPAKKTGLMTIFAFLFVGIVFFACGMLSGLFLITSDESGGNGGERVVIITTTPLPVVGGDDLPQPTPAIDPYEGWIEYLFRDCGISVFAPPEWSPSAKGEADTCGIFRFPVDNSATSFDNYDGVQMVFVPFLSESKYSFDDKNLTIESYMSKVESNPEKRSDAKDFLLETYTSIISNNEATFAVIDRKELGNTRNIMYKNSGDEFVIIWGGNDVDIHESTIDLMLKSIKFI